MGARRRVTVALALALGIVFAPSSALAGGGVGGGGAGTLTLAIDHPSPPGHNYGYLDYFSRTVTVQQGQVITWRLANFTEPHTVTILPAGVNATNATFARMFPEANFGPDRDDGPKAGLGLVVNKYARNDCGNSPYAPATGPCVFSGSAVSNSGFLLSGPQGRAPSYSVRFNPPPGIYHYFCLIHGPDMSGTIRVVAPGAAADTQASINARAATQAYWSTRNTLAFESHAPVRVRPVGGHSIYTVFTGGQYGRVAIDEYLPRHLSLKPGDQVVWTPGFHTVTFPSESGLSAFGLACEAGGGDKPLGPPPSFIGCANTELNVNPAAAFPSGPPGRAYTGGFYGSGILVVPKPHVWSASFPKGGTFHYDCLIHPNMDASISVG